MQVVVKWQGGALSTVYTLETEHAKQALINACKVLGYDYEIIA